MPISILFYICVVGHHARYTDLVRNVYSLAQEWLQDEISGVMLSTCGTDTVRQPVHTLYELYCVQIALDSVYVGWENFLVFLEVSAYVQC
ncbi:hypothetical protein B0H14DRAFT_3016558 [Mycena olivaceomarginata]|nr:hypothetical protein B0H14DRAFT_3016558 [Mycena olivaceomarginata]